MDWTLVIRSNYIIPPQKEYVPLSYDFIHGRGPYDTEREFMTADDLTHWFPRYKYQRQSIDTFIRSGPAVATGDNCPNIQAKIKYNSFLSGAESLILKKQYLTPTVNPSHLRPITSTSSMKSLIQQQTLQKKYTHGTLEENTLQKQLQKELQKAKLMTNLCSQMESKLQQTSNCKQRHKRKRPRKHKKRHYSSSSSSSNNTTNNSSSDSET